MKWLGAVLFVGCVASAGAGDDRKDEMRKLEGAWKIESVVLSGKKQEAGGGAPDRAVIKDGKATFFAGGKEMPTFRDLEIELDPAKKPKAMDLVRGGKEDLPCIYEVSADELKVAMPLAPAKLKPGEKLVRPESFDSKDKPFLVLTAKRDKK